MCECAEGEDQENAHVEGCWLSRDEERKVPERQGDHGASLSLSTRWACAQIHLLPSDPLPLP